MIFRIFIGLCVLLGGYIVYDTVRIVMAKSAAVDVADEYVMAAEDANLTVVEYVDYSCIHCQQFHPIIMRSVNRDGKIRFIVRPILSDPGGMGTQAALLAYAAGRQGKFVEAHNALIENFRNIDAAYISNFALEVGLDTQQLEADLADPSLIELPQKNLETLLALKGQTIPTLLVGDRVILQVMGELPTSDQLLSLFNRARTL